jgi:hypothetical protein
MNNLSKTIISISPLYAFLLKHGIMPNQNTMRAHRAELEAEFSDKDSLAFIASMLGPNREGR